MANNYAVSEKIALSIASLDSTLEQLGAANSPQHVPVFNREVGQAKIISGQMLASYDGVESPVAGVRVELYTVSSARAVLRDLPKAVLDHCRSLLLGQLNPIDLYQCAGHVIDSPMISFADVVNLRKIPGYELIATAAKSQSDHSFKQLLSSNFAILHPLLCYYHPGSFPAICTATTTTDAAGRFHFSVPQGCNADEQPGYRFIVRHRISSSLYITLYDPMPATWHTHWDCSDAETITLRTLHPLALRERPSK